MVSGTSLPQNSDGASESLSAQAKAIVSDRPAGEKQAAASSRSAGFGSLAKKISGRTTDLIAIAIVLTVGLSVGGSLVDWWRGDPEDAVSDLQRPIGAMQWGAEGGLVALRFGGERSALSRQTVTGDRQAADEALRTICRQIIENRSVPTEPPGEREQSFMNSIRTHRPIETKAGRWRLYRIQAPVLMIVGIGVGAAQSVKTGKRGMAGSEPSEAKEAPVDPEIVSSGVSLPMVAPTPATLSPVETLSHPDKGSNHHPPHRERVICWGLAFPTTATSWTLYTFSPSGDGSPRPSAVEEIPLPPESRRILSMRDPAAGEFCLFAGKGPPEVWMRFFDGWFTEHGGGVLPRWHATPERWWTRFVVSGNPERSPNGTVDINIQRNSAGQWTGVVSLLPAKRKRGRR